MNETSILATTPDLTNPKQIKLLLNKIDTQINRIWQHELDRRFSLTYWLAVSSSGSIFAYHPVVRVSQDNLELTPLPELIANLQPDINISELPKTAKL